MTTTAYADWTPNQHIQAAERLLEQAASLDETSWPRAINAKAAKAQAHIALATFKRPAR